MENPFDLRAFLAKIDAAGQLRTITGAALDTEVGALTELNGQRQGPEVKATRRPKNGRRGFYKTFCYLLLERRQMRCSSAALRAIPRAIAS